MPRAAGHRIRPVPMEERAPTANDNDDKIQEGGGKKKKKGHSRLSLVMPEAHLRLHR